MPTPAERSAERAQRAYEALKSADTFADARTAWEDFLTHWRRGLNRCDALGRHQSGRIYTPSLTRISEHPALVYLWAARNAEEHGVDEIATLLPSAIAIGAFGQYREEEGAPGPNGERTFVYTPQSSDPPPFLAFIPEHLKLQPIVERDRVVEVPTDYNYDLGQTSAPVALAKVGLDFLLAAIVDVSLLTADSEADAKRREL